MFQLKLLLNKIKENYWQIILLIMLLIQNKILLNFLSVEDYGLYIFNLSIGGLIGLIFPIGVSSYLRKSLLKEKTDAISKYITIGTFFLLISIIVFVSTYAIFQEKILIFYFIFYMSSLFNYYDIVLLTYDKVNLSRFFLFFQSVTFVLSILLFPKMHFDNYLILFSLISLLRVLFGWIFIKFYVINNFNFKWTRLNKKDKKYIFKISLSDYLNSIVSHLDSIFIGYMSSTSLTNFQLHKIIPNAIKSNVKLFFIKDENKLLKGAKGEYFLKFIKLTKDSIYLIALLFVFSIISTVIYIDYFLNTEIKTSLVLTIIFSFTIVFKILNTFLVNHNIFLENAAFYLRFNFFNKTGYLVAIFVTSFYFDLTSVVLIILINDIIIFSTFLTRIYVQSRKINS